MTSATCVKCKLTFHYEPISGRSRRVCPACLKLNLRDHKVRWLNRVRLAPDEEKADHLYKAGLAAMSREEIAWRMGTTLRAVDHLERTALAKIRQHPEAAALFKFWKAEGAPTPGPQREAGEVIMEWQMEMSKWRELQETWAKNGLTEEAEEAGRLIEAMQGKVREAMQTLKS